MSFPLHRVLLLLLACLSTVVVVVVAAAAVSPNSDVSGQPKIYRTTTTTTTTRAVQVIHRHGDRTPITPMKDETFWSKTLVPTHVLQQIAAGTRLIRNNANDDSADDTTTTANTHGAQGRGPFGKLTQLGLLQMIRVGNALREQYVAPSPPHTADGDADAADKNRKSDSTTMRTTTIADNHHVVVANPYLWHPDGRRHRLLHPRTIRVISTDFPRTIQSVRGLLVGLFPDGIPTTTTATTGTNDDDDDYPITVDIDVRHTNWMIPDPQPRQTVEQEHLEVQIATSPAVQQRESQLRSLAERATVALHPFLGADAHEVAFGVVQEHAGEISIEVEPLAWNQLAELTTCLVVRDMLPPALSVQDQQDICKHAAWLWFHTLRHPRMAYLSMHRMTSQQVEYFEKHIGTPDDDDDDDDNSKVVMTLWSAHDSTLIGLLCAYRLERPAEWPEYASYLIMELIEVTTTSTSDGNNNNNSKQEKGFFVRFSLNGQHLKMQWEDDEEGMDMIPLALLRERIDTVGSEPTTTTTDVQ